MSGETIQSLFRRLPSIGKLLETPEFADLVASYSRDLVVGSATALLDGIRGGLADGRIGPAEFDRELEDLAGKVLRRLETSLAPSLRRVINATGVIVFTNAGRAPIRAEALGELAATAGRYSNLEYDLAAGSRGHRDAHFESRVVRLLGCEAATVCNNAAAALLLILNTLASGRKVLVSRGELIEIGGSFRLPSIMEKSGAVLREVGTTNRTRARDYAEAVDDQTAMVLRVHPSNYQIVGFTVRPGLDELAAIARSRGIPLVDDVGSGVLFRTSIPALAREPVVTESLQAGADIVCFSGDKLFGGPQAGLIVGGRPLVDRVRKNPLMRAMRVDKLIYSVLELTLREYELGRAQETIPTWRFLNLPVEEIRRRAERLIGASRVEGLSIDLADGFSLAGGGSAPEEEIPTCLVALSSDRLSANQIEQRLRRFHVPVIARIEEDRVLLDLRTVFPDEDDLLIEALSTLGTASA